MNCFQLVKKKPERLNINKTNDAARFFGEKNQINNLDN